MTSPLRAVPEIRDVARDEMIESRRKLALLIGHDYCNKRGLDPQAREEVLADALEGLVRAVDAFDPDRGVKLNTYLKIRVLGAILDGARSRHHLKRGQTAELIPMQRPVSLDRLTASGFDAADNHDPFEAVDDLDEQQQLMGLASQVMALHLTPVQRTVVQGHLLDGRSLSDIAGELGVSTVQCSRLLKLALTRMRWHMKDART
jgi:RNA polymerase sigma factor (sigma-70 family)